MTVRPRQMGHIGLAVRDLDRMVSFYEQAIGLQVSDFLTFPPEAPFERAAFLRCGTDHHVISMFALRDAPEPDQDGKAPRPGMHHFAFEMTTFEDLRNAARYVHSNDIPLQGIRQGGPGSQMRVYFWDPEDNMIELYWAMDHIGWDGVSRQYRPIEPIDLETIDVEAWLAWKGPDFEYAPTSTGLAEPT